MNQKILNREEIAPRSQSWQQIEVKGEHPAVLNGKRVIQVIDDEAIALMNRDFRAQATDPEFDGMLIDADHLSHDLEQKTEAYAWLMNTEIRNGELWGLVEWTDIGAPAVRNRRYKFFSTEYDAGDLKDLGSGKVRPTRLAGLALTNRPNNKGGRAITNRNGATSPEQNPTQDKPTMKNIAEKLGLPAEATEEEIVAAIEALQASAKEAATMKDEAEVETILNRHSNRFADDASRAKWKTRLIANREHEEILAELPEAKAEGADSPEGKGRPAITNRAAAAVPGAERAHGAEGDGSAIDAATSAKIKNRASEIDAKDRCGWREAFRRATAELRG